MNKKSWIQKYSGTVIMAGSLPMAVLITINYLNEVINKMKLAIILLLLVILLNVLAIWAWDHSRKMITKYILILYILAMSAFFAMDILINMQDNNIDAWAIDLLGSAYFFIFGYQLHKAQQKHIS